MAEGSAGLVHPAIAAVATAALQRLGDDVAEAVAPLTVQAQGVQLDRMLALEGPAGVLLAGRRFDRFHQYPLFLVLLNSDSVRILLEKIVQLNRYFHSHHRHRVVTEAESCVDLEHVSTRGPSPRPVESLFVAGLYLAMLEQIGCHGLRCAFPASDSHGWAYSGGVTLDVPATGTEHWRFQWTDFTPRRSLPGLDELILADPGRDLEAGSIATQVANLIERDLSRHWKVPDIADELMMSSRTLQRRLQAEDTSFTDIVTQCRIATACKLLVDTRSSVTDIGYMLGFSDTPHFTRTFTAAMGRPPSRWREQGLAAG